MIMRVTTKGSVSVESPHACTVEVEVEINTFHYKCKSKVATAIDFVAFKAKFHSFKYPTHFGV